MTVLRIRKKEKNFLILDKTCLSETKLSWAAKGLHAYLMSQSDNWNAQVNDLVKHASNGRDSVRNILNELKDAGYITTESIRTNGKFKKLQYIVHEIPVTSSQNISQTPETENPSVVEESTKLLEPENPSPVNPNTEKPSLININNNNYQKSKAAAGEGGKYTNAAAANFLEKENLKENLSFSNPTPKDSMISSELTSNQQKQIEAVAKNLHRETNYDVQSLAEDITYCILNPNNFKACGNDFLKKLNSIRVVIRRGQWQRPAELVTQESQSISNEFRKLELELREAKAEINHFTRLNRSNKHNQFEKFINAAKEKALRLESQIKEFLRDDRAVIENL